MTSRLMAVLATAAAALFLVATGIEQAAAQRGGRDGARSAAPPSGGGPSFRGGPSAGPRFDGGRRSSRQFDGRGPPAFSRERSRGYGYAPRYERRDRRLRVRPFVYGAPLYDSYGYRPCGYYYRQAVATGSGYWWRRYRACTRGYD